MKKIILILALFMLLKPVFPVIDYVVNYEYISSVLCENKAKPKMHCNGKCHLMKELAKASENETPSSPDKKNVPQESDVLFFEKIASYEIGNFYPCNIFKINNHYSNFYFHLNSTLVFHPPTFIS